MENSHKFKFPSAVERTEAINSGKFKQWAMDTAINHLVEQGGPGGVYVPSGDGWVLCPEYFSKGTEDAPSFHRCAVGCLLVEQEYEKFNQITMLNGLPADVLMTFQFLKNSELKAYGHFLHELQQAHDQVEAPEFNSPEDLGRWRKNLLRAFRDLAEDHEDEIDPSILKKVGSGELAWGEYAWMTGDGTGTYEETAGTDA